MNIVFKVLLLILLCSFITGLFVTLFELIKKMGEKGIFQEVLRR